MNKLLLSKMKPLKKLMENFGMTTDDWCISGECAWIIYGYDVAMRENHIDLYVKESKLPWSVRDRIQTIPPNNSLELDKYCDFIEKHKIALHMVPLPKPGLTEKLIDLYKEEKKIGGVVISVICPEGNIYDLKVTLSAYHINEFGHDRLTRWKAYLETVERTAEEKKDKKLAKRASLLLKKYFSE